MSFDKQHVMGAAAVTQADRDAAWPLRPYFMGDSVATVQAWNAGKHDATPLVQAFAKHRLAALEASSRQEERLREEGERELAYFNKHNCVCTFAQRYVETCPKHGNVSALPVLGVGR